VKKVDERNLTVLNVSAVGNSNYELNNDEKIDKGFSLLN
jgi:hypothetical protein